MTGLRTRAACVALVAATLAVRIPDIFRRPFHTDEAVNAFILGDLLSGSGYAYRPEDHHGPTLYYLAAAPLRIAGITATSAMSEPALRMTTVVCGAGVVAGLFLWRRAAGDLETVAAAAFVALAAPFVYCAGTFIHESLLLALIPPFVALLWRWRESGNRRAAAAGGLVAGLMIATKETAAPLVCLAALAFIPGTPLAARRITGGLLIATAAAAVPVLVFFSDFGRHPERLADLLAAVRLQTARGLGVEHAYPWYTHLTRLASPSGPGLPWSGWLVIAAGIFGAYRRRSDAFVRGCALWALLLFIFHSALPYKTPWLMPAFLLPAAVPAGCGIVAALRFLPRRSLMATVGLLLAGLLCHETYVRAYRDDVTPGNPLAYSPTSRDTARLQSDIARHDAAGSGVAIHVVARDYWPLPWTLRRFPAGFRNEAARGPVNGLLICGPEALGDYAERAPFEPYEIRPGVFVFLATGASVTP